jgi:hypothetical protein
VHSKNRAAPKILTISLSSKQNTMKKSPLIITTLFLFLTTISFGQCKFDVNEVDKFTGIVKVETKSEVLHKDAMSAFSFNFCRHDNSYFVRVGINLPGELYSIVAGDRLILICGGSTITLTSKETRLVKGFVSVQYLITTDQIKVLNEFNITDMRLYLTDGYIDKEIVTKKAEKILQLSRCISPE